MTSMIYNKLKVSFNRLKQLEICIILCIFAII
nr:MAG TPA: hypothetical protein [Caudoviricetes sp.]